MNNLESDPSDAKRAAPKPVVGVGVVIFRPGETGQDVLLIRRARPPRLGEWSIPGGKQEWGETLQETAHREVREETGVTIAGLRLIDVVDSIFRENGVIARHLSLIDYRADWVSGEPVAGDDAGEARWVPVADIGSYGLWSETIRIILAGAALKSAP